MAATLTGGLGRVIDISQAVPPYDSNSGAKTSNRISMQECGGVMIVIHKAAGIAGDDTAAFFTLYEDTAYVAGTSTALAIITKYWTKKETALDGDEAWTVVTQAASSTCAIDLTSAEAEMIIVLDVRSDQLSDGYTHIHVTCVDTGSGGTQPYSVLFIPYDLKVQRIPSNMPNWLRPGAANA